MAFSSEKGRQGAAGVSTGFDIDNSLRFNDDDSAYLNRTFGTATNRKKFTFSVWVKRGNLSGSNYPRIISTATGNDNINFMTDDTLRLESDFGSLTTSQKFRDPSAWYHILYIYDSTISSPSGLNQRLKLYVNGSQVSDFASTSYPTLNQEIDFNSAVEHQIGRYADGSSQYMDGYLAEVHFIDGTALDHTSFGEFGDYGEWKPIEVSGLTYGTNGFYLPFSGTSSSAIVDSSGSGHSITLNGNTTHSSTKSKIGATSIYLDGTGDNLQMSDNGDWQLGTADFTLEGWFNFSSLSSGTYALFSQHNNDNSHWKVYLEGGAGNNIRLYYNQVAIVATTSAGLSTNTWHHIAVVRDSTGDKIYVDGTQVGSGTSKPEIGDISANLTIGSGEESGGVGYTVQGYLDEIRISTGIARYTSSFTPSTTAFVNDSYTKLLIHSDYVESNSLGGDNSPNNNHWTTNNLASTDQMLDTPTNNFATINPLFQGSPNSGDSNNTPNFMGEGNLYLKPDHETYQGVTQNPTSGKWYTEIYINGSSPYGPYIGWYNDDHITTGAGNGVGGWRVYFRGAGDEVYLQPDGGTDVNLTSAGLLAGEIVQLAWDIDAGKAWLGRDGDWYDSSLGTTGNPTTGANAMFSTTPIRASSWGMYVGSGDEYGGDTEGTRLTLNFGQDSSFAGNKTAQGNQDGNEIGDFFYTPPSGFLALCTKNLPDPAVIPSEHFNTVLYTANESTLSVTGVGFQPDFVWIKSRASTRPHTLFDVIRGVTKELFTNQTSSEETYTASLTAFDSDGFSLGDHWDTNEGTNNHVAWNWKANGTGASNTNGTINTTATSANTDAGFSISTYTGNGTAGATVGHGLSSKPDMMIVKKRSASPSAENWTVYHTSLGATKGTYLNLTSTPYTLDIYWNNTEPTNNVFSIGDWDGINTSGEPYVAYCFHSVDGYSKVGSFEGNASTSGNFIYTGFTPALVILHNVGDGGGWPMMDNARGDYNSAEAGGGHELLRTNSSGIEGDSGRVDLLSNGFRPTVNYGEMNAAFTYVYIAFAESPFKHTNAK